MATITPPSETVTSGPDTRFFGHPRGLSTLFFTEMWERFSYYGMRALLILFMTAPLADGGLGFDTAKAGAIYGTYVALVYLTSLPGGWIADRFLGQRRATLYGGILIMLGHIALAFPSLATFYLGSAGRDRARACSSRTSARWSVSLYTPEDRAARRRLLALLHGDQPRRVHRPAGVRVARAERAIPRHSRVGRARPESAWHWGFGNDGVGMFFGLMQYLRGWKHLGAIGMRPVPAGE